LILNIEELREYVGTTGDAKDSLLTACLKSAEREVLNFCHRSSQWTGFESSTGTRYYRSGDLIQLDHSGLSGTVLWLGDADLLSVDSLTNGEGTAISSTGYWLEPRNKAPYRYIRLRSSESWVFDSDGEVEVAGSWGYSTGPDDTIKQCVRETARYLLDLRASQVWDVTATPELGIITVPKGMPAHVKMALSQGSYRRGMRVY
jgi:hypothetical protein